MIEKSVRSLLHTVWFIHYESDRWKVPEYSRSVFLLKFNFSTCSRFIPVPLEKLTDRLSFVVSLYFRKIQETTNMTNHPWDNKLNNLAKNDHLVCRWPRKFWKSRNHLFVLKYPTTSYWVAKTKEHDDWHLSIMSFLKLLTQLLSQVLWVIIYEY